MADVVYDLAIDAWRAPASETVTIISQDGTTIGFLPLPFVLFGGSPHWRYVMEVVQALIAIRMDSTWILTDDRGNAMDLNREPRAGTYKLLQITADLTQTVGAPPFARGPQYFRRTQAANPAGSESTRSDSKRSSVNQSRFRLGLIARDSACLVTDAHYLNCTASHIVPFSRPDVYRELLEIQGERPLPMFDPSFGLLLRDDLHHSYDRLEWGLYYTDGVFFVHFFVLSFPEARRVHGKTLALDRFRSDPAYRPDIRFTAWHYRQCLMVHIRGFAVGMTLPVWDPEPVVGGVE